MADRSKIAEDADALYIAVAQASRDDEGANTKVFSQEELLELSNASDNKELMPLVQHLVNALLLRTLKVKGKLTWGPRPREAAKQMQSLDQNDRMIYSVIEEAHTNGVWSRDIRKRTSIAQNAVTKSLNKMEKTNLVKSVKSVKNPAQRTYMLYHLVPSEDVTGNSFFDAGDLDESFRDELMNLIIFWVRANSWTDGKRKVKRESSPPPPIVIAEDGEAAGASETGKKRKRTADIEDAGQPPRTKHRSRHPDSESTQIQLIYRAGTHNYPTAEAIHQFLTSSNAIKATKAASLTVQEIQGCIDVLIWDEKLERVHNKTELGWGYRTVRGVTFKPIGANFDDYHEEKGTGLTQAPCGRCPVFDLCRNGGPVNPAECVYYDQWLEE